MFLGNRIFQRIATSRHIQWFPKSGGAFIKFNIQSFSLKTLYFVHREVRFKHLISGFNLKDENVTFPAGINNQTKILDFLMDKSEPKAIQMMFGNRKRFLRNLACQTDLIKTIKAIENPDSIYSTMKSSIQGSGTKINSHNINYFLTHFYLRLSAQKYCKLNNIPLSTTITQDLKVKILDSIGQDYDNNSPSSIKNLKNQLIRSEQSLRITDMEIEKLNQAAERKLLWYKFGAIVVTAAHIVSFGYMIFFIDWLGWDIIQPLTYTVGVFYTLLGIRFYRKFRIDRTSSTVREALLKILMKPSEKVMMKDLKGRKAIQEMQLKKIKGQITILQNRVNFQTSLSTSFK